MTLQLTPKAGMLLVKPITPKPAQSPSGLIQLADVVHEPETSGVILRMGDRCGCPGCGEVEVGVGDLIVFAPSTGDEVQWEQERYLLIPEHAVLGVVSEAIA